MLSQTYKNIEINIGDNSENSESEKVFKEYSSDTRIKYHKHEKNIGASANYHFVRDISNGKYFMWTADDDYWDRTFIEKAVDRLENDPEAVGCWSQLQFFDENGLIDKHPSFSSYLNSDFSDDDIVNRLIKFNLKWEFFQFYGLLKTNIAKQLDFLKWKTIGVDNILFNCLVLSGRCLFIKEILFYFSLSKDSLAIDIINNYKSEIYNEYTRINPHLELFITCFQLILVSENLSLLQKIVFYFKYWIRTLLQKPSRINMFCYYPIRSFFLLVIRKRDYFHIIICIPLFLFLFFSKVKRLLSRIKRSLLKTNNKK